MKLPILPIVREAYGYVWAERRLFWALAIPAVIVLALVSAVSGVFGQAALTSGLKTGALMWALAYATLQFGAVVMYSVAWHRAYLLPSDPMTPRAAYRWGQRQVRFLFAYFKLLGVTIPFGIVVGILFSTFFAAPHGPSAGGAPSHIGGGATWFAWSMAIVGIWIYARLSMMFPAAALDAPSTIAMSWRMTKGNGFALFWIIVLVAVPITGISFLITEAIIGLYRATTVGNTLTVNLLISLITIFMTFIGLAVGVSAVSISYKRLIDAGVTGETPRA